MRIAAIVAMIAAFPLFASAKNMSQTGSPYPPPQYLQSISLDENSPIQMIGVGSTFIVQQDHVLSVSGDSLKSAVPWKKEILNQRASDGTGQIMTRLCVLENNQWNAPMVLKAGTRLTVTSPYSYRFIGLRTDSGSSIALRCYVQTQVFAFKNYMCAGSRWENCWKVRPYIYDYLDVEDLNTVGELADTVNGLLSLQSASTNTL